MLEHAAQLETYLLETRHWVSSRDLCARFGINERALRAVGENAGLCSGFAISGDKGFKHIAHATPAEWDRFQNRLRRHGIAELIRVRNLRRYRSKILFTKKPMTFEKVTGQAVFKL